MCPLCLTSLAITVATTTGVGATAVAVAARVAKSLVRPPEPDTNAPAPVDPTQEERGGR
jgi:hypothetical protein